MTEIRFASFTVAATAPLHSAGNNTMVNLLFPCPSLATPLKILVSDKLLRFEQNRSIKMQKKKIPHQPILVGLFWFSLLSASFKCRYHKSYDHSMGFAMELFKNKSFCVNLFEPGGGSSVIPPGDCLSVEFPEHSVKPPSRCRIPEHYVK